jgi:uncharacterized protein YlxW (UPF0749 family)
VVLPAQPAPDPADPPQPAAPEAGEPAAPEAGEPEPKTAEAAGPEPAGPESLELEVAEPEVAAAGPRPWWRILRGPVAVAFLCGSLGFALAAQLASNDSEDNRLSSLRQSDLVRILDELDARERRLRSEISDLEFRHQTLTSRTQGSESALADAQRRAAELGILAGTVPAEGPGLVITISETSGELGADRLLDAVQELRGAGAEALAVGGGGGQTVRIGASSYFVDVGKDIEVDGVRLTGPFTITAIGDPPTVEKAMRIPGGVVAVVHQDGCTITLEQRRTVQITAVRTPKPPRFAQPAS